MSKKRPEDQQQHSIIEVRPGEYKIRLTSGWAKVFFETVDQKAVLNSPAFSLVTELRAIAFSASLPYTIVDQIVAFYRGYMRGGQDLDASKLVRATAMRFCSALTEQGSKYDLTKDQKDLVRSETLKLEREMSFAESADFSETLGADFWKEYMEDKGFKHGVWGSQRQAYVSIYNAYDSFLVASMKRVAGTQKIGGQKEQAIGRIFGEDAVGKCWSHPELEIGRLVRHAISHAEGKETSQLKQKKHDIVLTGTNKLINVFPADVKRLLRRVETASMLLVEQAGK